MKIAITVDVTDKRIAYLLSAAFEGGVGYWCQIVGYVKPDDPRSVLGDETIYRHIDYPLTGGAVRCRVVDEAVEDPGTLILDREAIKRGLRLMAQEWPQHWADFMDESEDASTADVFLQCALLGGVVYG